VRGIELEIEQSRQRSKRIEQQTRLIENEILLVRSDSEQIESEIEQIEKEIEQLRRENARERALSALIKQHCFPPECSSTPPQPTEPDCGPFLP